MAVPKIVLYYAFAPLADPEAIRLWQRDLAASLGLRGRILISKDGINGTLGGELNALKRYVRTTREYAAFKDADYKCPRALDSTSRDRASTSHASA